MRFAIALSCLGLLAGCTTGQSSFNEATYGINRAPNSAPRGSEQFCRIYGDQTTANEIESSSNANGRGTSGFDKFVAQSAGRDAYERCRAGQTN